MIRSGEAMTTCVKCLLMLVAAQLLFWLPATGALAADSNKQFWSGLFGSENKAPAPDFELKDLKGTPVRLSKFKGEKPVLLYFWATWCPYCIQAKPKIAQVQQKMGEKEMQVFGINVGEGDTVEKLKRYQEGHPVAWQILYDEGGQVSRTYRVQGIPLFVLVDKDGSIVYRGNDVPDNPAKYLK
ncbi:MAG: peroxiredoxin family protein [Syntrophobacteraceae bacterium]